MARVMLNDSHLPQLFWVEAVQTTCQTVNKIDLRLGITMTPYKIWKGKKLNLKYLYIFLALNVLC